MNKKEFIISAITVAIAVFAIIYAPPKREFQPSGKSEAIKAEFFCDNGQSIKAIFYRQPSSHVDLTLSNGKTLQLPQAISASGARYANADESFVFWNKGDTAFIEENGVMTFTNCVVPSAIEEENTNNGASQIANPASVNCEQKGGKIMIESKPDGSQYGLCYFDDARACEEWAMIRGECPVGGVKTTGYDTQEQKFCAWLGGKTFADPNAVCDFSDGSTCELEKLYSGQCQRGDYKVEKKLDQSCLQDSDCTTPPEYLVQSRCPFTAKCLNRQCAVVCPDF